MYICAWLKNNNSVIPPRVIFREGGVRFGQVNLTTKNTLVCFFSCSHNSFACSVQIYSHKNMNTSRGEDLRLVADIYAEFMCYEMTRFCHLVALCCRG